MSSKNKNLKTIIGNNIFKLRRASGMTQLMLAEMLNYSDKTVSKWERGEALPDITVLIAISDLFNVTLDYLTVEHDGIEISAIGAVNKTHVQARAIITGMSLMLIWLIATFIFVVIRIAFKQFTFEWLAFIYAVPATMITWLIFNSVWFNKRRNYLIITCIMWSILLSFVITFFAIGYNVAVVLLLGIPGQVIIFMWSGLGQIIKKAAIQSKENAKGN